MNNKRLIQIFAIIVILIGIGSTVYVQLTKTGSAQITVNGKDHTINQLFDLAEARTIEEESGIALDDLMVKVGIENPEEYEYTIIGADGYQKTVKWENMRNGLLTVERESIFSDLPKAFRIEEIIEIKVE